MTSNIYYRVACIRWHKCRINFYCLYTLFVGFVCNPIGKCLHTCGEVNLLPKHMYSMEANSQQVFYFAVVFCHIVRVLNYICLSLTAVICIVCTFYYTPITINRCGKVYLHTANRQFVDDNHPLFRSVR